MSAVRAHAHMRARVRESCIAASTDGAPHHASARRTRSRLLPKRRLNDADLPNRAVGAGSKHAARTVQAPLTRVRAAPRRTEAGTACTLAESCVRPPRRLASGREAHLAIPATVHGMAAQIGPRRARARPETVETRARLATSKSRQRRTLD
eukprot:152875-Pleurochrysis_carterae.AAC.2